MEVPVMAQRLIKRLLALMCVFALLLPVPSLGANPFPFVGYIIKSTALRANASNKANVVVQLPAGSAVQVTGEKDDFYIAAYDGRIGYVIQSAVSDNYNPSNTDGFALPYDIKTATSYPLLEQEDSGDAVEDLQNALKELGFLSGKVDGKYGVQTKNAVAAFQKSNELPESGTADPKTQQTLFEKSVLNSRGKRMYVKTIGAVAQVNVRRDDRGTQVKTIQNRLKELGYYKGAADGVFGLATVNAVKALQRAHHIKADGIVGAKTREALALGNALPLATDAPKQQPAVTVTLSPDQIKQQKETKKQEATYPYITTASDPVNLRTRASIRSTRLVTIPRGASINVLSVTNDQWLKVEYGTRTGYVMAQYINIPEIYLPGKSFEIDSSARVRYETLAQGASGFKVSTLQEALKELNFYSDKIDGLFGSVTAQAVQNFQNKNGYKATGIALPEMQQLLYEGKPRNAQGRKISLAILPPIENPDMSIGDKGAQVKSLQTTLAALGYYTGAVDGIYGRKTANAVKAYQKAHSIRQTGKMDSFTWLSLNTILATPSPGESGDYYFELNENNVIVMTKGTRGLAVTKLETRLIALGYTQAIVDGVYSNSDIEAVRAFQRNNGLTSSGIADLNTQRALYRDTAIGAADGVPSGWQSLKSDTPAATATPAPGQSLRIGSTGEAVKALQARLIALNYLSGTADGIYGTQTARAVTAFQKAAKLKADGIAGQQTFNALYGANAPGNLPVQPGLSQSGNINRTMRIGDRGQDVKQLQQILYRLGYLKGGIDGIFGPSTALAVSSFQKRNSLTADSVVGTLTWAKLNSSNAIGNSASPLIIPGDITAGSITVAPTPQGFTAPKASEVRFAMWSTEVKSRARSMPRVIIYDFMSGKHYNVNIFSNGAHADGEPITAEDTATMEAALGKDNWTPRPVWVIFSDGRVYMASTHSRGHEVDHNPNNNLQGHICIHFPREMSDAEKTGPYAVAHQNAILAGWDITQSMIK